MIASIVLVGCITIKIDDSHYDNVDTELINKNATENTKKLYKFLLENYGKKIITGQYVNEYENYDDEKFKDEKGQSTVFKANEVQAVNSVTGDYPAMLGFDLSKKTIEGATNHSIEQAIEFYLAGGIVNFCWHWVAPTEAVDQRSFYSNQTNFSLKETLKNRNSFEYKKMISDIDAISYELKKLQDVGVPVLWRPLHEASGGWFWWGDSGKDAYKELWDILYDRMTNYHQLNNLIWISNAQKTSWYVGDEKCDILGYDPYYQKSRRKYYERDKGNSKKFKTCYRTSKNKMIAMTENDFIPDIDTMWEENTKWSMFSTWCREFVCVYENNTTSPIYSQKCTTIAEIKAVYDNDKAITLAKMSR